MRNKSRKQEYDREYYKNNAERRRARYKVYYQTVKEKKLAANKVWMANNKDYRQQYSWKLLLKNKYGITEEIYNDLFEKQAGCCRICGIHQSNLKKRLYVDHDHISLKVRALLCVNCNMLIGHAQEDIKILEKSINYLKHHGI